MSESSDEGSFWLKRDDELRYVRRVLEAGAAMTTEDQRAAIAIVHELRSTVRTHAEADSAVPSSHVSETDGWKLVPLEPTDAMAVAAVNAALAAPSQLNGVNYWRAMIAASPVAPESANSETDVLWVHDFGGPTETIHNERPPFGEESEWTEFRRASSSESILREALAEAIEVIKAWHGTEAWDIYLEHSPEMRRITSALGEAARSALAGKRE